MNLQTRVLAPEHESQTSDTVETTTFTHDLTPVIEDSVEMISEETYFQDNLSHDISDILARPYQIQSFTWNTSHPRGKLIGNYFPVDEWLKKPNVKDKISRFAAGRFSLRLRLRATFQRYHAGKLLISAFPQERYGFERQSDIQNLFQESTAVHVELDAGSREEVLLELPYYSALSAYNLVTGIAYPDKWNVVVRVLNPLTGATNSEVVTITAFVEAYDIELHMAAAQSTEGKKKTEKGIISSVAGTVKQISGALTAVPFLSEIAGPVSWVASGVESLASAFGFSKPMNLGNNQRITQVPAWGFTNTDGEDNSVSMSYTLGNSIQQLKEEDDMQISNICKRQGLISLRDWKTSDPVGTEICSFLVTPSQFNQFYRTATTGIRVRPPVSVISTLFKNWRGTLRFRFSFAKNTFYSGKLIAVFRPNSDEVPTLAQCDDLYKVEISIRDSSEFIFDVPWFHQKPWLDVNSHTGVISLLVSNPLQSAETVSDTIGVNTWISSEDIQFADVANDIGYFTRMAETGVTAFDTEDPNEHPWTTGDFRRKKESQPLLAMAQGILPEKAEGVESSSAISLFKTRSLGRPITTMGEEVTNLRTLIRRFLPYTYPSDSVTYGACAPPVGEIPVTTAALITPYTLPFFMFGSMFRFWRGGIRVKAWAPKARYIVACGIRQLGITPYSSGAKIPMAESLSTNGFNHIVDTKETPVLEVSLPFYSPTERRYTGLIETSGTYSDISVTVVGALNEDLAKDDSKAMHYIAGDDCSTYSMYMYCPVEIALL